MISKFTADRPKTFAILKIPRRPEWDKDMTSEEIDRQENAAFLEWRRDIAGVEESTISLAMTPFEKNVHVWR